MFFNSFANDDSKKYSILCNSKFLHIFMSVVIKHSSLLGLTVLQKLSTTDKENSNEWLRIHKIGTEWEQIQLIQSAKTNKKSGL